MAPFFADNGFYPQTGAEPPKAYEGDQRAELLAADRIVANQKKTVSYLQDQLMWSQQEQAHWANQNCQPHPRYNVKDMVYVDARYFSTSNCESKSLSLKNAGPWKSIWNIGNKAYEVDIPQQIKETELTPIFHLWKLHLTSTNLFPKQVLELKPLVFVSSSNGSKAHKEQEVLEIVDS